MPALLKQEEQKKIREGESLTARPLYLQAVADYKKSGEFVYPDANLSLRITFGNVMGYGKDGVTYTPFTTLEGVAAKETGEDPFDSPKALLDAVKAKRYGGLEDKRIGSVPVNFLSNWTSPAATRVRRCWTPTASWSAWPSMATGNRSAPTGCSTR